MKKILLIILMSFGLNITHVNAQSYSAVFNADYDGKSIPFSYDGLSNRLAYEVLTAFDLELSQELMSLTVDPTKSSAVTVPLNLPINATVGFHSGINNRGDGFYIYQTIRADDLLDFETISTLLEIVDPSINFEDWETFYDQWAKEPDKNHNQTIENHEAYATTLNDANNDHVLFFETRFNFPLSMFDDDNLVNLVGSWYDSDLGLGDIYSEDYEGETVYVNRAYINRILDQLEQLFNLETSEAHIRSWGNSVYFYATELAELGRLNELYLFSGATPTGDFLEIRFTTAFDADEMPDDDEKLKLNEAYFNLFAKLLDPDLSEEEIAVAYEEFSLGVDTQMGEINIRANGFTPNTISLSRKFSEEQDATYISSVPEEHANEVLIDENSQHLAEVLVLNNPSKIYGELTATETSPIFSINNNILEVFESSLSDYLINIPAFKEKLEVTGTVSSPAFDNWLVVEATENDIYDYYLLYLGDGLIEVEGDIEIVGQNLGMQNGQSKSLVIIPENILQNGEIIYPAGGENNE
ncbi:hypothetical protein ACTQ54_02645 [Fundicoccus sp. Sow4_H7]|uniref:hypothetical protein n=1 Tax=Fundicoccus sp. Sow4_H7 TaxID=3438784 RepID=UPI003F930F24